MFFITIGIVSSLKSPPPVDIRSEPSVEVNRLSIESDNQRMSLEQEQTPEYYNQQYPNGYQDQHVTSRDSFKENFSGA